MTDPDGHRAGLAPLPVFRDVEPVVRRQIGIDPHQPRFAHPAALDRHVVDPGLGIGGHHVARGDVVPRVAAMLLERGQRGEIGPVALRHDRLYGGVGAADDDRGDCAGGEVGQMAGAVAVIRQAERGGADFPASRQVAQHRHVALRAVGADGFVDEDDGLALPGLQRMQDGGDLFDHGERAPGPEHPRRVGREERPEVGRGLPHAVQSRPTRPLSHAAPACACADRRRPACRRAPSRSRAGGPT